MPSVKTTRGKEVFRRDQMKNLPPTILTTAQNPADVAVKGFSMTYSANNGSIDICSTEMDELLSRPAAMTKVAHQLDAELLRLQDMVHDLEHMEKTMSGKRQQMKRVGNVFVL